MVPWGAPQEQGWRVRAGPLGGRQGLRTWDEGAPRVEEGVRRGGGPHGRGEGGCCGARPSFPCMGSARFLISDPVGREQE